MFTLRNISFFISILFTGFVMQADQALRTEHKSIAIVLDLDDVVNSVEKRGFMDFIGLARIALEHPYVLTALLHINELKEEGMALNQELNGASNVIHAMLASLKERGYGDFSAYEDEIIERIAKPKPIQGMIEAIKALKAQGYLIIGATNHDWKQDLAFRQKMLEQGVNLNELFDAVLVTRVNHIEPLKKNKGAGFYKLHPSNENDNLYVAKLQSAYKPHKPYYLILKSLVQHIAQQKGVQVEKIIFTDDKKENTDGARAAGIEAIHFDLPGVTARKTSPEGLQSTIDMWKGKLREYNVTI